MHICKDCNTDISHKANQAKRCDTCIKKNNQAHARNYCLENREKRRAALIIISRRWREKHPDQVRAIQRKWLSNNRDKTRASSNRWRANNLDKVKISQHAYHERNQSFINALKNSPCADCSNSYPPYIMEFDHVRGTKRANVSSLKSLKLIKEELLKCDLVCANCHRTRTYRRKFKCELP